MIPLVLALALVLAPAPTVTPTVEPPAAESAPSSPEDTLAGLEQIYSTTCAQTGILYHSYDDLCDGLRRQIAAYQKKMSRVSAKPAKP